MSPFKLVLIATAFLVAGLSAWADVSVRSYYRKDGTYVAPHMRSSPNGTKNDNWSTRGNVNPYTGEAGTRAPDPSPTQPAAPATAPVAPEAPQPTPHVTVKIDPSKVGTAEAWNMLGPSLNADDVKALLGEPVKIETGIWRYPDKGCVAFGSNGQVGIWIPPAGKTGTTP